jgi:hypothetical protein
VVFSAAGAVYRAGARREDYRHRRVQTFDERTAEIKRIWTDKTLRQQGLPARGAGAGAQGGAGRLQPDLPDNRLSSAGSGRLYLSQGYQPQFDLNRDPEEYSQPPFDGRLRFTKTLVREAFSKTA